LPRAYQTINNNLPAARDYYQLAVQKKAHKDKRTRSACWWLEDVDLRRRDAGQRRGRATKLTSVCIVSCSSSSSSKRRHGNSWCKPDEALPTARQLGRVHPTARPAGRAVMKAYDNSQTICTEN